MKAPAPAPPSGTELAIADAGTPSSLRTRFTVHAKPKAKKTALVGVRSGRLEVFVAAPPVDGKANDELVRFLAAILGVPKRSVRLAHGDASRTKVVEVDGVSGATVCERLLVR